MAYKVEFPPGLSPPKNTGDTGDNGDGPDLTEGRIVAVKICSTVLDACIWLSFDEDFRPDDGEPLAVFYADELPLLSEKTPEQLRVIHKVKLVFGPGSRVRE